MPEDTFETVRVSRLAIASIFSRVSGSTLTNIVSLAFPLFFFMGTI